MEDFYVPSNFNFVDVFVFIKASHILDCFNYRAPSLALKLGHSLKKIADILDCEAKMADFLNEEFLKILNRSRDLYEKKMACVFFHLLPCKL